MPKEDEEVSLRDDIAAAFDEQGVKEDGSVGEPAPKEEPPKELAPKEEPPKEEAPPAEEKLKDQPDAKGKSPPEKAKPTLPTKDVAKPEAEGKAPPAKPSTKPPGGWSAQAREKWATLPKEVQDQINKRETEIRQGFNELDNARKFNTAVHQTLAPYQNIIAAEGGNPIKFIGDLMVTAATLYHGTAQSKVNTIAAFIKNFGVDVQALDSALADQMKGDTSGTRAHAGGGDAATFIRQAIQQELAPILRGQQVNDQRMQQEVTSEIETFAQDAANEFFEDVKDTMADLLEVAAKQGKTMDLSTAYKRATMMHSEIADVINERALKEKAASASAAASAARKKAVSVTGAPARESGQRSDSLRGDIEAAIDQLGT